MLPLKGEQSRSHKLCLLKLFMWLEKKKNGLVPSRVRTAIPQWMFSEHAQLLSPTVPAHLHLSQKMIQFNSVPGIPWIKSTFPSLTLLQYMIYNSHRSPIRTIHSRTRQWNWLHGNAAQESGWMSQREKARQGLCIVFIFCLQIFNPEMGNLQMLTEFFSCG